MTARALGARALVAGDPAGRAGRSLRPAGRFGMWRALTIVPALVGSVTLMAVLTAGLGAWGTPVFVLWLVGAAAVSTRVGERLMVRGAYRFRPLSARQRELFEPVRLAALRRCGLSDDAIDWYVQAGRQPNACAAGRYTVAVTDGALASFLAGRLPADLFQAVLLHELGHHATRAGQWGLAAGWLAAPGRVAFRLATVLAQLVLRGRRPGGLTWLAAAAVGVIATVQRAQQGDWVSVGIYAGIAAALIVTPLLDGVVSRASEHAADRYVMSLGAAPDLARALVLISPQGRRPPVQRLVDRHPSIDSRLDRLAAGRAQLAGGRRERSV